MDSGDINGIINSLSGVAAQWYGIVAGRPVVQAGVPGIPVAQQQQAAFSTASPTLAGLVNSPLILILGLGLIGLVFYFAFRRG